MAVEFVGDCATLVKANENGDPRHFPQELDAIVGTMHTFQFHHNPACKEGYIEFVVHEIFDMTIAAKQIEGQSSGAAPLPKQLTAIDCTATTTELAIMEQTAKTKAPAQYPEGAHTEKLQRNVRNGEADSDYADEISYLYTADVAAHREGHVTTAIPAATEAVHYSQRPLAHYQSETSACKKQSHTLLTEAGNSHHGMTDADNFMLLCFLCVICLLRITGFGLLDTKKWMQTLPNNFTLILGKLTDVQPFSGNGIPIHHFNFAPYSELSLRADRNNVILTDFIGCVLSVGAVREPSIPSPKPVVWRDIVLKNLDSSQKPTTGWSVNWCIPFTETWNR